MSARILDVQMRAVGLLREEVIAVGIHAIFRAQPHAAAAALIEHVEELHRESDARIGIVGCAVAAERVAILREEALQILCRAELQAVEHGEVNLRIHRRSACVMNGELEGSLRRFIHLHRHRTTQRQ